jgi:hypothetical protein
MHRGGLARLKTSRFKPFSNTGRIPAVGGRGSQRRLFIVCSAGMGVSMRFSVTINIGTCIKLMINRGILK